jgi:hypothetical protein
MASQCIIVALPSVPAGSCASFCSCGRGGGVRGPGALAGSADSVITSSTSAAKHTCWPNSSATKQGRQQQPFWLVGYFLAPVLSLLSLLFLFNLQAGLKQPTHVLRLTVTFTDKYDHAFLPDKRDRRNSAAVNLPDT